ncbi:TlpA disulfide reductase family protein [Spirosoma sordidisoli]|uniref:TlpA family protein disulfide reductase n=1 Tax=Spirosoma sordidisoli TaxID=2502893 RepID=A0A4Q2UI98_9BACT|nr:TlpA disulfide reductase family protein [Spirosoma sordidisoli]RYC69143.1 TlpA family protein disulfide reductase [Spirosoma sordidisoli]
MKKIVSFGAIALLIATAMACSGQSESTTVTPGQYRAVLKTRGGDLPFGLDIQPGQAAGYTVFALNGSERLPMDPATVQGDSIRIPMALFESELVAKIDGNTLRGVWRRRRTAQQIQTLPFEATLGYTQRFVPTAQTAVATLTGSWATDFGNKSGRVDTVNAVGVFKQTGNRVAGTFLTPTGDYRYLDGNVVGDSLFLSCFDGSHLFLFKARHNPQAKTLSGGFWSGVSGYEPWAARFDPAAKLPDPASLTYLKPGAKTLRVSFPEPNGQLVSLSDPRFKNKVTVVQILGSWCPNCMDETNFLSPWYKRNRSRGVEVLGLAFERSANMAESGPKIDRMKQRFQIDYPVVLAGTNDKAEASKALPDLNAVVAFPTTLFIDKKGQVRHIHTGFSGPGTGAYYDQYVSEFNRLIDKLLAE